MRRPCLILALAALVPSWGCSFVFVRGPPAPTAAAAPEVRCTREAVAPAFDTAAAVVLGAIGVAALAAPDAPGCPGPECYFNGAAAVRGAGVLFLGAAAVSAASSLYGFVRVNRCEAWTTAREACWRGDAAACAWFVPVGDVPGR